MSEIIKEYGKTLLGIIGALALLSILVISFLGTQDPATNQQTTSLLGEGIGRLMDRTL